MKLKNIKTIGKFEETVTMKLRVIKQGRHTDRSTDHYFYLESGKRVFITDREFHNNWKEYGPNI